MRSAWSAALSPIVALLVACSTAAEPGDVPGAPDSGGAAGEAGVDSADAEAVDAEAGLDGDGGCDPATQINSAQCTQCASASIDSGSCSAAHGACAGDVECTAAIGCMKDCLDEACQSGCIKQHPAALQLLFNYVACLETSCHDDCYCESCRFGNAQCRPCLETECGEACSGCDRDSACMALVYCLAYMCTDPNDTVCPADCSTKFDTGVTPWNNLGACGEGSCKDPCGF